MVRGRVIRRYSFGLGSYPTSLTASIRAFSPPSAGTASPLLGEGDSRHTRRMSLPLKRRDFVINAHLQHAWRRSSIERLDPHISVDRERRAFELIAAADPTTTGRYLLWLSTWRRRQWESYGLRYMCGLDGLDEVREGLQHFDRLRPHLAAEARDVGRYPDVASLLAASTDLSSTRAAKIRQAQKARAMLGTEMLYEGNGWSLLRIKDKEAAQWWGLGTRWCTAARDSHWFEHYNAMGNLLVLLSPRGRFQLHAASNQARDALDVSVDLATVIRSAPPALRSTVVNVMRR